MRHRRYHRPTNPPGSKVPIWSENDGIQERIEVAKLVGKLILLHHSNGGTPMRIIFKVTPQSMKLIVRIAYSHKMMVEVLPLQELYRL